MSLLERIPNDGTFDQSRPLEWIKGAKQCFSFDLKSATDRWPLYYLFSIVVYWLGHNLAGSIVNTTRAHNLMFLRRKVIETFVLWLVNPWVITPLGLFLPYLIIFWCGTQRN
jgi:hypothetical protein